ncbi:MAG: argininosuccinate lyase [Saprospiraceae bacterium]|nr:MAG: argininosuccinate lyase [Saprospiraceae bacterium]
MKLWQKAYGLDEKIEQFTVGQDRELDLLLAPYDILGSLAHIRMLEKIDLLTSGELHQLTTTLQGLYQEVKVGNFSIEANVEDVHSQIELLLTQKLGAVGKKIHSGRSRNDQVLVDLRLYFRAEIEAIATTMKALFDQLQELSEKHQDQLMPGYTHLQVGMVSSFGLWFGAYAESLVDDLQLLRSVFDIINQNPLGSAAGYGSSFPLQRKMTTDLLGFADLNYNVVHAQLGRGKSEHFMAFSLAAIGHTLGKLAMDIVLFSNQNFSFLTLPDDLTTGSSIMPHKKNPDVFELIRGRCNQLQALPVQVSQLTGNLPSGYHRDFQLLKEVLFPAISQLKDCLSLATYALGQIQLKANLLEGSDYDFLFSVEEVNRLVLAGVPFRDAYHQVGQQIAAGNFHPDKKLVHTHEGSIGNLCTSEIKAKWDRVFHGFGFEKVAQTLEYLLR